MIIVEWQTNKAKYKADVQLPYEIIYVENPETSYK